MSTEQPPLWRWQNRLHQYLLLVRLDRPIGIFLLLWPTLWALWIAADGRPDPTILAVFVAGVVLMRSAGCAINDYADRHFDPFVSRTRERPVASGRVSPNEALAVFVVLALIAFSLVLLWTNWLTITLSLGAALLAAVYPFTKRYTHLPQLYLGTAFGWAIPMAFAAQTGDIPAVAWTLFAATVLWALAYDTLYAMADREEDWRIGVKSTAILFGHFDRLMVGVFHACMLAVLIAVGVWLGRGRPYYAGLVAAAALAVYQQILAVGRDPVLCLRAFLNNSWMGAAIFAGIALDYLRAE